MAGLVDYLGNKFGVTSNPVIVSSSPAGTLAGAPVAGTTAAVAVGGTAVTAIAGPIAGGYITNPLSAAAQGVAVENLYVDPVASPASTDAGAVGTTSILAPGQSYIIPPLPAGSSL